MKNLIPLLLICIFTLPLLAKEQDSAATQTVGFAPTASPKKGKIKVADYKSFLEYAKNQVIVRTGDPGEIQLDKDGVKFPTKKTRPFVINSNGEKDEVGFRSTDKRNAGIFNLRDKSFRIYNGAGNETKRISLSKFPIGVDFTFSDTRIFAVSPSFDGPGGFELFTSTGQYLKWVDVGDIAGYTISSTQRYFMVTSGKPETGDFFVVFDMEGNELWKLPIVSAPETQIYSSPDDKFAVIKASIYWVKNSKTEQYETVRKTNKLYVIDIDNQQIVSEEDYVN